jgi:hypothetical protein
VACIARRADEQDRKGRASLAETGCRCGPAPDAHGAADHDSLGRPDLIPVPDPTDLHAARRWAAAATCRLAISRASSKYGKTVEPLTLLNPYEASATPRNNSATRIVAQEAPMALGFATPRRPQRSFSLLDQRKRKKRELREAEAGRAGIGAYSPSPVIAEFASRSLRSCVANDFTLFRATRSRHRPSRRSHPPSRRASRAMQPHHGLLWPRPSTQSAAKLTNGNGKACVRKAEWRAALI